MYFDPAARRYFRLHRGAPPDFVAGVHARAAAAAAASASAAPRLPARCNGGAIRALGGRATHGGHPAAWQAATVARHVARWEVGALIPRTTTPPPVYMTAEPTTGSVAVVGRDGGLRVHARHGQLWWEAGVAGTPTGVPSGGTRATSVCVCAEPSAARLRVAVTWMGDGANASTVVVADVQRPKAATADGGGDESAVEEGDTAAVTWYHPRPVGVPLWTSVWLAPDTLGLGSGAGWPSMAVRVRPGGDMAAAAAAAAAGGRSTAVATFTSRHSDVFTLAAADGGGRGVGAQPLAYVGHRNGEVALWDARSAAAPHALLRLPACVVAARPLGGATDGTGHALLVADGGAALQLRDGRKPGSVVAHAAGYSNTHQRLGVSASWDADGGGGAAMLAACCADGVVRCWDIGGARCGQLAPLWAGRVAGEATAPRPAQPACLAFLPSHAGSCGIGVLRGQKNPDEEQGDSEGEKERWGWSGVAPGRAQLHSGALHAASHRVAPLRPRGGGDASPSGWGGVCDWPRLLVGTAEGVVCVAPGRGLHH